MAIGTTVIGSPLKISTTVSKFQNKMNYNRLWEIQEILFFTIRYVSCMNPTSGSFTINPRLQRHFAVFAICFPGQEALTMIYSSILTQHYANAEQKFNISVTKVTSSIVVASLALHAKVAQVFLPTALKSHYIFNLRDLR